MWWKWILLCSAANCCVQLRPCKLYGIGHAREYANGRNMQRKLNDSHEDTGGRDQSLHRPGYVTLISLSFHSLRRHPIWKRRSNSVSYINEQAKPRPWRQFRSKQCRLYLIWHACWHWPVVTRMFAAGSGGRGRRGPRLLLGHGATITNSQSFEPAGY